VRASRRIVAGSDALLQRAVPRGGAAAAARSDEEGMTCGDLFAGIGGMSLGLERAGFTVRWQVEREPFCENILARHWPDVVRRRDVRFAGAGNLEPVDLIAGGFPCQDISAAGRGVGLTGHRSGLWREFARIVRELRPRWVLVENVPALRRRGADTVLGDLEAASYACWPLVVGARHVGAPHRRDRVWIVGRLGDAPQLGERAADAQASALGGGWAREDAGGAGARVADGDGLRCKAIGTRGLHETERDASGDDADRHDPWPARPGEPQRAWEQPRTVESPLGRRAHGLSARLASARWRAELKALGNSVVPQVVEMIGRAILAIEAAD
jgi:DNA (cytosine-5)-methyltransferase 1